MIESTPLPIPSSKTPAPAEGLASSRPRTPSESVEASSASSAGFAADLLAALGLAAESSTGDAGEAFDDPEELELLEGDGEADDALDAGLGAEALALPTAEPTPADPEDLSFQPLRLPQLDAGAPGDEADGSEGELTHVAPSAPESFVRFGSRAELNAETPVDSRSADVRVASAPTERTLESDSDREQDPDDATSLTDRVAQARTSATPPVRFQESLDSQLQPSRAPEVSGTEASARPEPVSADSTRLLPELPVRNESNLLEQARLLIQQRGGEARIELEPPQLGNLGLRISVTHHSVHLDIVADRLPVAELFQRHLPELQHALASQGLHVDRANIEYRDPSQQDSRSAQFHDAGSRGGSGRRDQGASDEDASSRTPTRRIRIPAYSLGAIDLQA